MTERELSEFEQARARKLAQELVNKLSEYFPRETTDEEMAEVRKLREELEKMGFRVEWSVEVDFNTGEGTAKVTLWIPQETPEPAEPPQE